MRNCIYYTRKLFITLISLYLSLHFYQHANGQLLVSSQVSNFTRQSRNIILPSVNKNPSNHTSNSTLVLKTRITKKSCIIPYYWHKLKVVEPRKTKNSSCGIRAVKIKKSLKDRIKYIIDEYKMKIIFGNNTYQCCHQFAFRSNNSGEEDTVIKYTPCIRFRNGTSMKLLYEVIKITCRRHVRRQQYQQYTIKYEDVYIVLKREKKAPKKRRVLKSWNILLLGMDTMSRMRAYRSIPETVKYFKKNNWLDYRRFVMATSKSFPNIMNLLTGKNMSTISKACSTGMSDCNELMIWSEFKKRGYFTAYGEDNLDLPDTFSRYNGFKVPPTDHYARPFFLTGEHTAGNIVCTKSKPSALHLLDYAYQFARAYKYEKFFGLFWINSFSHNPNNRPALLQQNLIDFFKQLNTEGILNRTIVIFFSQHGIRFGDMKIPVESYYDERSPMLFMRIPQSFKEHYNITYRNLYINQHRLTTHYDLYSTLWDILRIPDKRIKIIPPEACRQCTSLFKVKSKYRSCTDMNIAKKWCTCNVLEKVSSDDIATTIIPQIALFFLNNRTKTITTNICYRCSKFKLDTVLRLHSYRDDFNVTYYVVAFQVSPGAAQFEAVIETHQNQFKVLETVEPISRYQERLRCALRRYDHAYCICELSDLCGDDPDLDLISTNWTVNVKTHKRRKVLRRPTTT